MKTKKMGRRTIIFFLIATLSNAINGQVNLQTGSAVYNLSLFNWQDAKSNLSLGVALNYDSKNGLKVDEIASNIGQGWNLTAGGVITRIQMGEPDDQYPSTNFNSNSAGYLDTTTYPPGYLYNP